MTGKKWLIILGIINVLAIAGIVFWYVNRDNTPPVISWEGEIIYEDTDKGVIKDIERYDKTSLCKKYGDRRGDPAYLCTADREE